MAFIQEWLAQISPEMWFAALFLLFGLVVTVGVCIRLYFMKQSIEQEVRYLMYGEEEKEKETDENPNNNSPDMEH